MRNDMLFKVSRSDPWYANIINFMVAGYIPPGEDKKKLFTKVISTYGICHTSSESARMAYSEDVYWQRMAFKSLKDATHHHMEDILGYFALIQRFGRVDSIGQPCTKTQKISSRDVEHVRSMKI
jgi:hypothetical protein